ncbi:ADP-ribosylglycohydrolase family protein [Nocardia paucivorans]|uniref:ADP-ribosylglycohydrolase family protein n=1 Tax=Nocardia paucivorans TaxID=114259 RepID=UPI00030225D2|nr:ADP-ribosylglycohydrolase family protein [Nocardia paucivorans]
MRDYEKLVDKVRGTILGGAVGDALGWPIEFLSLRQIRAHHGNGGVTGFLPGPAPGGPQQITDDTQMTLFTAEGLLRCPPGIDPVPVLRRAYLRWLTTQREPGPGPRPDGLLAGMQFLYAVRAPGNACMNGLVRQSERYLEPLPFGTPGPVNPQSKGCGTVMRSAPFGLIGLGPEQTFTLAARCGQLTHGHPTGYLAAGAFAALVDRLIEGVDLSSAIRDTVTRLGTVPGGEETVAAIERTLAVADSGPATAEGVEQVGQGWTAEECLAVAVYCALHAERTGDIRSALLLAVNHSGDSDSTGAVAGNLLGAAHGLSSLPLEWVGAVEGRDVLVEVADDLVRAFHYRERPWPDDRYPLEAVDTP